MLSEKAEALGKVYVPLMRITCKIHCVACFIQKRQILFE